MNYSLLNKVIIIKTFLNDYADSLFMVLLLTLAIFVLLAVFLFVLFLKLLKSVLKAVTIAAVIVVLLFLLVKLVGIPTADLFNTSSNTTLNETNTTLSNATNLAGQAIYTVTQAGDKLLGKVTAKLVDEAKHATTQELNKKSS